MAGITVRNRGPVVSPGLELPSAAVRRRGGTTASASPLPFINVKDYGADGSYTGDQTAAIQAAINDAHNLAQAIAGRSGNDAPAITVRLPEGWFRLLGSLVLPPNIILQGSGLTSTYLYFNGTGSGAPITIQAGAVNITIADLGIINSSQIAPSIDLTGGDGASTMGDQHCIVRDVYINGGLHGITDGGTENRYSRVACYSQWQNGFLINSTDSFFEGCTAAQSCQVNATNSSALGSIGGFNIHGPNVRLYGCKAFGQKGLGNVSCAGFLVLSRSQLASCEAQDCQGYGFTDTGGNPNTYTSCVADSCGYYGFGLYGSVMTGCVALNRGGAFTMPAAVQMANACVVKGLVTNLVRRVAVGASQVSSALMDIDNRFGMQNVAYAATVTPDPWLGGDVYVGTLTGALTIANPQSNPTNGVDGTSAWYQQGQILTFVLPQDATGGRVVTFGTSYKLAGGTAVPTTASSTTTITFKFDGTSWREATRATT